MSSKSKPLFMESLKPATETHLPLCPIGAEGTLASAPKQALLAHAK